MKTKILVIIISFIFLFTYTIECFAVTNTVGIENVYKEINNEIKKEETEVNIEENTEKNNFENTEHKAEDDNTKDTEYNFKDLEVLEEEIKEDTKTDIINIEDKKEDNSLNRNNEKDIKETKQQEKLPEKKEEIIVYENNVGARKYEGIMYTEAPKANHSINTRNNGINLTLSGWAVSNDTAAKLQCFIDGKNMNVNFSRNVRTDVDKAISGSYGGTSNTPKAGFYGIVNISKIATGKHTVKIRQISSLNEIICENDITVNIVNPPYTRKDEHRETNLKSKLYKTR